MKVGDPLASLRYWYRRGSAFSASAAGHPVGESIRSARIYHTERLTGIPRRIHTVRSGGIRPDWCT